MFLKLLSKARTQAQNPSGPQPCKLLAHARPWFIAMHPFNSFSYQQGDAKPRKVLVEFDTDKDVTAVLRAARNLRKYNEEAKAAGKLPIGIERSLTEAQRKHKNSIWASFKSARDDGKRAWWRGHRLFIEGEEVFPIGNSS